MSLLMKALEKAAKDRVETDAERATSTSAPAAAGATASADAGAAPELTLEPITAPPTAAPSAPLTEPPSSPRRPAAAPARKPPAAAGPAEATAAAATVIRAGQRDSGGGAAAYVREHPLIAFGMLAALFLLGYGGYVYIQLTHPGLFVKSAPRPAQSGPIVQAPGASTNGGTLTPVQPPVATTLLLPPLQAGAEKEKPAGPAAAPAPAPARAEITAAAVPTPPAIRDTIKITASNAAPAVNPLLSEAYAALTNGNLDSAGRLYGQMLRGEPGNLDALLGLAAIAMQQGNGNQAAKYYLRVIELDPRNTLAQAGLIGLLGGADPLAAETRVKLLIAREPSAFLYFTLGNVYVDQNRWPDAQQAYFQAHHLQPDNPDYAYNLAVGLEHVGQSKLALDFYRRAMQLADAKGRANFSMAAAQGRISKLEKVVQ